MLSNWPSNVTTKVWPSFKANCRSWFWPRKKKWRPWLTPTKTEKNSCKFPLPAKRKTFRTKKRVCSLRSKSLRMIRWLWRPRLKSLKLIMLRIFRNWKPKYTVTLMPSTRGNSRPSTGRLRPNKCCSSSCKRKIIIWWIFWNNDKIWTNNRRIRWNKRYWTRRKL